VLVAVAGITAYHAGISMFARLKIGDLSGGDLDVAVDTLVSFRSQCGQAHHTQCDACQEI
jgi:hypothetical protein